MTTTLPRATSSSRIGSLVAAAAMIAIAITFGWISLARPDRAALRTIDGVVTRVGDASSSWKGVPLTREEIVVRSGALTLQLRHEYLPQLRGIQPGDSVHVLADPDVRGFFHIWELQRNGLLLLSYEQSLANHNKDSRFPLAVSAMLGLAALALAVRYVRSRLVSRPNAA